LRNPYGILGDVELNSHGSTLEETRPDHLIYSALTSTNLSLCCVILKIWKTTKGRNVFFWKFQYFWGFHFWLSYCT